MQLLSLPLYMHLCLVLLLDSVQLLLLTSGLYQLFTKVNRSVESDHWVIATALK